MATNENQPTTFGAIIERKPTISPQATGTSPPQESPLAAPQTTTAASTSPPQPQQPQSIPPALHLATPSSQVDQPLPSPFSIHDSQHEKAPDLEAGLYTVPTTTTPPAATLSTPRPTTPSRQVSSASTASSSTAGHPSGNEKLVDARSRECTMWPSQHDVKLRAKKEKRARIVCAPMRRLSKRNRVIVSVVIALTVVAAAVGIGVGISRAYHGEVWAGQGKTKPVPQA